MPVHKGRYLKISFREDRNESIPVPKSYRIPELDEEWLRVRAADGSVAVMRVEEITTIHLTDVKVA